jgi:integrase
MVRALCSSGDGVQVVVGVAGAGKTFALDAAREAWEASRYEPVQVAALLEAADLVEREHRGLGWADVKAIRGSDKPNLTLARKYEVSDTLIRKVRRGELWTTPSDGRRNRNDIPRKPIIAMLALAGLRISELCGLDGEHMDFAHRRIKVPRGKTVASERVEPMAPTLREILLAHRADYAYGPKDPVFATRTGRRNTPDNIRNRVLAPVRARANELLLERGQPTIGHLTPHTLRRTFASMLAELGVNPRRAMYLLGHVDPTLTMRVYQHVLDIGSGGLEVLESVVGGTADEVLSILNGRGEKPMKSQEAKKQPSSRGSVGRLEGSKTSD